MPSVWHEDGQMPPLHDEELHQAALGMLSARRAMRGTLPSALIHDVALEMLLCIYLARHVPVPVEELVTDATLPASSARRWLAALTSEELAHVEDQKVTLTAAGRHRMSAMLTSVICSQRRLLGWEQH